MKILTILLAVTGLASASTPEQYAIAEDGTPLHWRPVTPSGSGTHPVVILLPGGEYRALYSIPSVVSQNLANAGFMVFNNTEYRIAPPRKLPSQITDGRFSDQTDDVSLAVAVAKVDSRCNGEVFVVGGSAGASHAFSLAAKGLVKAAVCLSPATQFDDAESLLNGHFRIPVENYVRQPPTTEHLQEASPLSILTSNSTPIFMVSFTQDNIPAPQFDLAKDKPGVTPLLLPGAGHSWDCWQASGVPGKVIAFLNAHRGGSPTPTATSTPTPEPTATETPTPEPSPTETPIAGLGVGVMYLTPSYKIRDKHPPDISGAWNDADSGVALRTQWSRLQPREDTFDWSYLDASVAAAKAHGKKISISCIAGVATPDWVYAAGAKKFMVTTRRGTVEPMPLPWDSVFQQKWGNLVKQLGARYGNDIVYVVIGGPGRKQESFFVYTDADIAAVNALGGLPKWEEGVKWIIDTYAKEFPMTTILLATGAPYENVASQPALQDVIDYGGATYSGKFAPASFGLWKGLPGDNSIGAKSVQKFSPTARTGFQMLRGARDDVTLQESLDRGRNFGAHFIEVYPLNFKTASSLKIISSANVAMRSATATN